jgi:uncharacterized protein
MDNRTVLTQSEASVSGFLSRVFLWMALGLAVSTGGAVWLLAQPELLMTVVKNQWIFFGLVIAELALVVWLSAGAMRMSAGMATSLFLFYSFLNGITLAPLFLVYTGGSIANTFLVTAGTFFFFALYGFTTKKDLTTMGGLFVMGLFGVILASIVNLFAKSTTLEWIITFVAIAVFLGLIAYDTQKLKRIHALGFEGPENEKRIVILGALTLYLDFINLFIQLLKIFGRRRD